MTKTVLTLEPIASFRGVPVFGTGEPYQFSVNALPEGFATVITQTAIGGKWRISVEKSEHRELPEVFESQEEVLAVLTQGGRF